jgi:hypothetical protein
MRRVELNTNYDLEEYAEENLLAQDENVRIEIIEHLKGRIAGKYGEIRHIKEGIVDIQNQIDSVLAGKAQSMSFGDSSRNGAITLQVRNRKDLEKACKLK